MKARQRFKIILQSKEWHIQMTNLRLTAAPQAELSALNQRRG